MPQFQIGETVSVEHKGKTVIGRVVGFEASEGRRGFPVIGQVLTVQPEKGEYVVVHSSKLKG